MTVAEQVQPLINPNLPPSDMHGFKDPENYPTGVFGLTLLEAMPPILTYKTRAKNEENMEIQPKWIENILIVKGAWGLEVECAIDTHVTIQRKGSMDKDLLMQIVLFYMSLYASLAPQLGQID